MPNDANANPSNDANNPNNGDGNNQPAQRPEFIAEKFWDKDKGSVRLEDLARAHGEAERRFSQGKQVWEQERLAQRPSTPDGYAVTGIKFENLPPDLVIHETLPTDKSKLDPSKRHFVIDPKDPMLAAWRTLAHENGMPPAMFQKGLAMFADKITERDRPPTPEEITAERQGEWSKLGEQGEARTQHVFNQLKAKVGDQHAGALDAVLGSAEAIEALEDLLIKAGAPKFGGTGGAAGDQSQLQTLDQQINALKADEVFKKAFLDKQHPQHKEMLAKMRDLQEKRGKLAA